MAGTILGSYIAEIEVGAIVWLVIGLLYGIHWLIKKFTETKEIEKQKSEIRPLVAEEKKREMTEEEAMQVFFKNIGMIQQQQQEERAPKPQPQPQEEEAAPKGRLLAGDEKLQQQDTMMKFVETPQAPPVLQPEGESSRGRLLAGDQKLPSFASTKQNLEQQVCDAVTESEAVVGIGQAKAPEPEVPTHKIKPRKDNGPISQAKRRELQQAEVEKRLSFPNLTPLQRAIVLSEILPRRIK